jgi:hypothetical protein
MAQIRKKSTLSVFPQTGEFIYFLYDLDLHPDNKERKYPSPLKGYDIGKKLVTDVNTMEKDGNIITKVLINDRWPVTSEKLVVNKYEVGQLIVEEEEAIKAVQRKCEEEVDKAQLIVKRLTEELESAKEDLKKTQEFDKNARTIESLETEGKVFVIKDNRPLNEEDIDKLYETGAFPAYNRKHERN